ncbi:hypothetical protein [Geminisphaera colitermitum]|uniref:hypothetical protein n=1 Tax=Geminisphaera colitermitum TaxID=1148786 RepID=UPI0001965170|nr:hypothetical protein [Geminisphaera colitermitum]
MLTKPIPHLSHTLSLCFLFVLAFAIATVTANTTPTDVSEKEWRQSAVNRTRRIIVNNDGNEPVFMLKSPPPSPTPDDLLSRRIAPLAGTQVDSLFYCTWSSGFGLFTHFTKIGQVFTSRESRHANNQMQALLDAGIDPLRVVQKFTREHNIELFWSMRMNDNHDGYADNYGPALFDATRLKTQHPEYLLGTRGQRLPYGSWSAVNYARPEIRELAFRYVEEVCLNYDVDGVELDFFRHPVFFPSTTRGQPCTDDELNMMTGLLRRIRVMADAEGRRRGRPLLIAVRVPDSAAYAKTIGLDLETWLSGDLLDLLIVGGYFQLNEWTDSVALARKHGAGFGIKVYPSLDDARVPDGPKFDATVPRSTLRMTDAAYRGRAAVAWAAGMDGLYFFNQFNPRRPIWREVGDPATLAPLEKDYFASVRGVGATPMRSNLPLAPWQTIETLNPLAPRDLLPGQPALARIQLVAPVERPARVFHTLGIRIKDTKANTQIEADAVEVRLNEMLLDRAKAKREGDWLFYPVETEAIRNGLNKVSVTLKSETSIRGSWLDLMVRERPCH